MESNTATTIPRIGQYWLGQGGLYAGTMRGEIGQPDYHLILPTDLRTVFKDVAWGEYGKKIEGTQFERDGLANTIAMAEAGSELAQAIRALEVEGFTDLYLPSRHEARLLFLMVPEAFERDWYWTSTQYSAYYAWCQSFGDGDQGTDYEDEELRARALRRFLVIQ